MFPRGRCMPSLSDPIKAGSYGTDRVQAARITNTVALWSFDREFKHRSLIFVSFIDF